ncbi:MAG: STAS/SEC14 domain-containing protein [bacterium]
MPVEIRKEGPRLLVVRISGVLRRAELEECQQEAGKMIEEVGKIAALLLLEGFQGWELREDWGDVSFLVEHDSDIEKIAIVGPERWRDEVLIFAGAGLWRRSMRYFNETESARSWLAGGSSSYGEVLSQ